MKLDVRAGIGISKEKLKFDILNRQRIFSFFLKESCNRQLSYIYIYDIKIDEIAKKLLFCQKEI